MTKVDQFESVFKAAARTPYQWQPLDLKRIMVLTDLDDEGSQAFVRRVRGFLRTIDTASGDTDQATVNWLDVGNARYDSVEAVLALIEEQSPDLIVTYRSLTTQAWRWSYTLGRYVEILAHETPVPVLLLPNPTAEKKAPESFIHGAPRYGDNGTETVMALTDHLTGDHQLIHWAVAFTAPGGSLVLSHIEDGRVFDRYMNVISKIPDLDTDTARERIRERLLREPVDYIRSVEAALSKEDIAVAVEAEVRLGHRLADVRALISQRDVDLLIMHTKDQDQLAMHGMAYPLMVDLRHVPILML